MNKYKHWLARLVIVFFIVMVTLLPRKEKEQKIVKVNGRKITSSEYVNRLKQQNSEPIIKQLIDEAIVKKEAEDKNIKVDKKEVDTEINSIRDNLKNQGKDLNQELKNRRMKLSDLENQIYMQKLISKLVNLNIEVKKEDVDKFIEENKESLPKNLNDQQLRATVENQVREKLQSGKIANWMESLYRKAKIKYY